MTDFLVHLARDRTARCLGAGLLLGLYGGRVLLEFALPGDARQAALGFALAALAGWGAGSALAWASGVTWPALLLLGYVLYPAISPEAAGVAGALALAAWLAAREMPGGWPWDVTALLIGFAVYAATASPGVLPADAGEFQWVVNELGVAHPPGYPLYTLLGWAFARLPLGAPAFRVNLYSALVAALTLAVIGHAVRRETRSGPAGLAAALTLGAATSFWLTATQASIRPMTALFTALLLDALLAYRRVARRSPPLQQAALIRFALCLGLAVTHHGSLLFVGVPFALMLLAADLTLLRQPRRWLKPGLALAAGFLPWLYLPLRAGAALAPAGIDTWDGFWNHVLARGFEGDLFYFRTLDALPERLATMGEVLAYQWHGLALAAAGVAALVMLWRDRWLLAALGGAFALHTLVTATYRAPQTVEYMMPAYGCLAAAVGWLAGEIRRRFPFGSWPLRPGRGGSETRPYSTVSAPEAELVGAWHVMPLRDLAEVVRLIFFPALMIALVFLGGALTFAANLPSLLYLHNDEEARSFAEHLLRETPDGAVVLANWHRVTPLWYLGRVEGQRPDVDAVYVYPEGAEPLADTWVRRIGEYVGEGRPVVVQGYDPDAYAASGYRFEPQITGPGWIVRTEPRRALPDGLTPLEAPVRFEAETGSGAALLSAPAIRAPGGYAPTTVVLAWQKAQPDLAAVSFVHATDREGRVVRQDDLALPAGSREPGEIILARYTLDRPPADANLLAGLYVRSPQGIEPLRALDGRERVEVGALGEAGALPLPPPTEHPRYDLFADGLLLTGYDYDLSLPGRARLYLHWAYRADGWGDYNLALSQGDALLATQRFRARAGDHFSTAHDLPAGVAGVRLALEAAGCRCLLRTLGPFRAPVGYFVDLPGPEPGARYVPLGSGIVLTGAHVDAPGPLQPGDPVTVTLRFRAAYPLAEDDVVKVDLIGPDWAWRAGSDHIPLAGAIPTLKWVWGSAITDRHTLTAPEGAETAGARLDLLLYDHFTGRPLPILDPALAAQGQTLTIWSSDVLQ